MLGFLQENTRLRKFLEGAIKRNTELLDIIIFGSAIRGKEKPQDIDVLLVFKGGVDRDFVYGLRKKLERTALKGKESLKVDVDGKNYHEIFEPAYLPRERLLAEGYSIRNRDFIHSLYGYAALSMFRYSLMGKSPSERVRFYYALLGRGKKQKGIIDEVKGIRFTNTVILVPIKNEEKFKEFLESWRLRYKLALILLPSRTLEYGEFEG